MATVSSVASARSSAGFRNRARPSLWVPEPGAGLHLLARLRGGLDDRAVSEAARAEGVVAPSLSEHRLRPGEEQGLVLGFGAVSPGEAGSAARALARAVDRLGTR